MSARDATVPTAIIPYIFYSDFAAALDWLARAFGFVEQMRTATPNGGMHAQMTFDGQPVMMGQGSAERRMTSPRAGTHAASQGVFVYLADVDAHHDRARSRGGDRRAAA